MRFQAKLIMIYAIFMLATAVAVGVLFYRYSVREFAEKELDRIESISQQTVNQMHQIIELMKYRTDTLLADPLTLNSLRVLSQQKDYSDDYVQEARNTLQKSLITDSIMSRFYRVIIYNQRMEVISTKNITTPRLKGNVDWNLMPWIERAESNKGKPIIVSAHEDDWGVESNKQVFSLIRAVQGSGMGYIEVQQSIDDLSQLISLPDERLEILILANEDELIYKTLGDYDQSSYQSILNDQSFNKGIVSIDGNGKKLVSRVQAKEYGLTVVVMKLETIIEEENRYILSMVVFVVILFYIITLGFIVLLSIFLTRPLKKLRKIMENTELNTIGCNVVVDVPNDEIMILSMTYQNVLDRLKKTLEEEKQILVLQMEAQYDLLQAQVNPHFLFNVLNVISNKGLMNNDESICEICGNLAAMLRYSTNVKEKYATVESEINYVQQYLNILGTRFEHKLRYQVSIDPRIRDKVIPKITIQQFVENSINHAFEDTSEVMRIDIVGAVTEEGWSIVIRDNGSGFSEEVIRKYDLDLASILEKLSSATDNIELEIGGMGLSNTYARMYLLYGERFRLSIANDEKGAIIEIAVQGLEECQHVQSDNR